MANIQFHLLQPDDTSCQLVAKWYLHEWNIPVDKTIKRLQIVTTGDEQFQVLMIVDDIPVATGGLYHHVGILDKEKRLSIHKHWLALVYTVPQERHKGYGALLCQHIQDLARNLGIGSIYLFTDTAERLYRRLGWQEVERVDMENRIVIVMTKVLNV